MRHDYFRLIWKKTPPEEKNKLLDAIASEKGIRGCTERDLKKVIIVRPTSIFFFFIPIFDELNDISYRKKYYSTFDKNVSKFVSGELLEGEILENFNNEMMNI